MNETLEVVLSFVGDALPGVDFHSNLERRGTDWVLRFDPGFPVLHVTIDAIDDGVVEAPETIALWVRPDSAYLTRVQSALATVELRDRL